MATYLEKGKELMGNFPTTSIEIIHLSKNANANTLAKLATIMDVKLLDAVSVEFLAKPSIRHQPEIMELTQKPLWMDPIITYLRSDKLCEGKMEAHILRLKATCYVVYDDKLYRRD